MFLKLRELDKWYELYVDELFAYGMAFGLERETAMDTIHDVFLHLYEHANHLTRPDNPKYYLLRSLKNKIFADWRSIHPDMVRLDDCENEYDFKLKADASLLIEEEEERAAYEKQVEHLLDLLTSKQREIIYLHFMQGLSYQEIADMLNITPKSVRKVVYRALERMQDGKDLLLLVFVPLPLIA